MSVKSKLIALQRVATGYARKWMIDSGITPPKELSSINRNHPNVIVSLTSYGRRVEKGVVYYTLVSLLRQTYKPNKIILWLDNKTWNEDNIPKRLRSLQPYGVEIKFCDDLRSYTKLVPALKSFHHNALIVTVDDDTLYDKHLIESLIHEHIKHPDKIIACRSRFPQLNKTEFAPYREWPLNHNFKEKPEYIMPIGAAGVLYPPNSLNANVSNIELFTTLCPLADDIWFWIMAKMNNTQHWVLSDTTSIGDAFDDLYQYLHKGSALTHTNNNKSLNDEQLTRLLHHFNLSPTDLKQR